MLVRDKIKESLKQMLKDNEFERIINYVNNQTEKDKIKWFAEGISSIDIDNLSVLALIEEMPYEVMKDLLGGYLLNYEIKEDKNND